MNGMACTGKSTIARTIARKIDEKGCLGASFFFSRDSVDLNNADTIFTTLAFQLTRVSPNLKGYNVSVMPSLTAKTSIRWRCRISGKNSLLNPLRY
jgi:hypothetical protein